MKQNIKLRIPESLIKGSIETVEGFHRIIFKGGEIPAGYKQALYPDNLNRGVIQNFGQFEGINKFFEVGLYLAEKDYQWERDGEFVLIT